MTKSLQLKQDSGRPELLFVYGTLMSGQRLHKHLAERPGVRYMGTARMRGELYRPLGRRYPGAVRTERRGRHILGELYELRQPAQTLPALDRLEGCDEGLFTREQVTVSHRAGKRRAWTYLYAKPLANAEPILRGNFAQYASATSK
ncbi:MAG: gamma-glutamylcyclotransferase family protein [Candidatus Acidiferrum sp.]